MNRELVKQFLSQSGKVFPNFGVYRINFNKKINGKPPFRTIKGGLADVQKRNDHKEKWDIYFSPNGEFGLNNDSERKESVAKRMFTFALDEDTGRKFWEGFLEPSIIVKTSHGYHAYWLLNEPIGFGKRWKDTEIGLCNHLGADKACVDGARVFRLPGTRYWKDNKGEITIDVIKFNPEIKYNISDFDAVLNKDKELERKESKVKKEMGDSYALVDDINSILTVDEVMNRLNSRREVRPNCVVYEDGEVTGGYKWHKANNSLRNFTAGKDYRPEGGPFAIAKGVLGSATEAFKFFRETFGIGEVYKAKLNTKEVIEKKTGLRKTEMATPVGDIEFNEEKANVILTNGNEEKVILDAYIHSKGYYTDNDMKIFIVEFRRASGEEGIMRLKQMGKPSIFDSTISEHGITFFGTKAQKQYLISLIHSAKKEYRYIDGLGVYDKDTIIIKGGRYIIEKQPMSIFVNIDHAKASDGEDNILKIGEAVGLDDVKSNLEKFKTTYNPSIVSTAFLSCGLSLFAYYIRKEFSFFPITTFVGLTQSGKTVTRRVIMNMFGFDRCLEVSASVTEFVAMKKTIHYLPLCVGEYQNDELKFDWDSFMKNNYDNTSNMRGRHDQTTIEYCANSPLIVDGESRSTNNAVYTRSIVLFLNPKYRLGLAKGLKNINKYFLDNYDKIYGIKDKYHERIGSLGEEFKSVDREEKTRIIENYAMILAFADCFEIIDNVKEDVLAQIKNQFDMMGENNVDKIIKTIFTLALSNHMIVSINNKKKTLNVDFIIDTLRNPANKVKDLQSNIQIVNHHFGFIDDSVSDVLSVPLDYLFGNKNLHILGNKLLDLSYRTSPYISTEISSAVKEYADANDYKHTAFYDEITHNSEVFRGMNKGSGLKGEIY